MHRRPREGGDPVSDFGRQRKASKARCWRVKQPVVYILAGEPYGTLYIGVTSNLAARLEAHRSGAVGGFTNQYDVQTLVYFELHDDMYEAIQREKRLKNWNRSWKIRLIEEMNPEWKDLCDQGF